MNVTNSGAYNYSPYGEMNHNRMQSNKVEKVASDNKDVNPPNEQLPNDIIKLDSQSYVVKAYRTYNRQGRITPIHF